MNNKVRSRLDNVLTESIETTDWGIQDFLYALAKDCGRALLDNSSHVDSVSKDEDVGIPMPYDVMDGEVDSERFKVQMSFVTYDGEEGMSVIDFDSIDMQIHDKQTSRTYSVDARYVQMNEREDEFRLNDDLMIRFVCEVD